MKEISVSKRRTWIDASHKELSIRKQCELAQLNRSFLYYEPIGESEFNLELMEKIDKEYYRHPEKGYRRMTDYLISQGYNVNEKRVLRLMQLMAIQAITPGPHTSKPHPEHKIYPYLLKELEVNRPNQVWSTDITYIPMKCGFLYLSAVMDWYSRHVISWQISNTMEVEFCIAVLMDALDTGAKPDVFNTDQGSQYTSKEFTNVLLDNKIQISMDGKGRALDNVRIERLWWTVKYENIYPNVYENTLLLHEGLEKYFYYYDFEREHSSLNKKTPYQVYTGYCNEK